MAVELVTSTSLVALRRLIDGANPITASAEMTVGVTVTARQNVALSCKSNGNVQLLLSGGGSVIIPVIKGLTLLPFAVTQIMAAGTTASGRFFNCTADTAAFVSAAELVAGAPAISAKNAVLVNCTGGGMIGFTLSGGGTLTVPVNVGLSVLDLAATQIVALQTNAAVRAWTIGRT